MTKEGKIRPEDISNDSLSTIQLQEFHVREGAILPKVLMTYDEPQPEDAPNERFLIGLVSRVTECRNYTFSHPITGIPVKEICRINWRLLGNGHVQRTNATPLPNRAITFRFDREGDLVDLYPGYEASEYKEWIDCETIPAAILSKARELDIQIIDGRQCGPWHCNKPQKPSSVIQLQEFHTGEK